MRDAAEGQPEANLHALAYFWTNPFSLASTWNSNDLESYAPECAAGAVLEVMTL